MTQQPEKIQIFVNSELVDIKILNRGQNTEMNGFVERLVEQNFKIAQNTLETRQIFVFVGVNNQQNTQH